MQFFSRIVCLFIVSLVFFACSSEPKEDLSKPALIEDITGLISKNLCVRVSECRPELKNDEKHCVAYTKQSLTSLLTGSKITFTQGDLKTCLESIKASTCDQIMDPDGPPEGCSKLQ